MTPDVWLVYVYVGVSSNGACSPCQGENPCRKLALALLNPMNTSSVTCESSKAIPQAMT